MKRLIECVPNFSEGRNKDVIDAIASALDSVEGARLLDVDPGKATNRTVMTVVGDPESVIEAAFQGIKKAKELIDMSSHQGEHARMGATDVCPLIPISGISMQEVVEYANKLAKRVGDELGIPIYLYEEAAREEKRKNLASIRSGEYEGLEAKLQDPLWKPDYGPVSFLKETGATVIGARDFLVAYNINLNTKSTRLANAIAFDVREAGRVKREGHPITGKIVRDENGEAVRIPGSLKSVKAIGWYIEEYGIAQISMNLTDINLVSVHQAYDEVMKSAHSRGARVTGSELVGLIPLKSLLDAGKHYLKMQNRSLGVPEEEIIQIAVKSLGLDELKPFDPKKKIIEYFLEEDPPLASLTLKEFAEETSRESPAPGGGSVSAYMAAMGTSLSAMVANLSANKRGWEDKVDYFSKIAQTLQEKQKELIDLVDQDTEAFNNIMEAFRLPKASDEEKATRKLAIEQATLNAIRIPLKVMQTAYEAMEPTADMAKNGNPNSASDAGVGALALRSGIYGAYLNVMINAADIPENESAKLLTERAKAILSAAKEKESEIIAIVQKSIGIS